MLSHREQSSQDGPESSAAFAHSLAVAPIDPANTISNISIALGNAFGSDGTVPPVDTAMDIDKDVLTGDAGNQRQPENRMALAELLVSLASSRQTEPTQNGQAHAEVPTVSEPAPPQLSSATAAAAAAAAAAAVATPEVSEQSPLFRVAVDYVASVKKAYENNPKIFEEFLDAMSKYHNQALAIEHLVRTVMNLFQDQPELLLGFKDFLPEAQGLMNQLVPPAMYSDYKPKPAIEPQTRLSTVSTPSLVPTVGAEHSESHTAVNSSPMGAADFLNLVKERSQKEPDMYQHFISFLRRFQQDHSYSKLYFYVSIVLRYHPHLLQRFHNFLPQVRTGVEVKDPREISKAPPEELVVSPDFIEAKDFVQTVKYHAKHDMSMYDRFIFALEKYQQAGWTIDQVYSEVSLIFWNHPDALQDFKHFITTVPQQP
ncbi:Paired amphipathic helix protein Sin3b [Actinomortierella ambigua]|uniref:Paired amphipathic helix protein Sin3b n=1 Tax=Actinomortierella ambigua TaxID=1343610 RepID=A0A9P6U8H9_9FUNG|nr:Paired amphipathic helix protein Sin3b [Actinomortierella ambigua]